MRIVMLATLLGTGLLAQTPTSPQPANAAARWMKTLQTARHMAGKTGQARVWLPPTSIVVTPSDSGGVTAPAHPAVKAFPWSAPVVLAPGQSCAIPLLNAMPAGGFSGDSGMAMAPKQAGLGDKMPLVRPPAPSCADVQR